MKTKAELKEAGFICSDPDYNQWVKKITETNFLVYENGQEIDIELNEYSETELRHYVSRYYSSLEHLRELYSENSNQIIAECIAEQY